MIISDQGGIGNGEKTVGHKFYITHSTVHAEVDCLKILLYMYRLSTGNLLNYVVYSISGHVQQKTCQWKSFILKEKYIFSPHTCPVHIELSK
jgi:hypothetical protein